MYQGGADAPAVFGLHNYPGLYDVENYFVYSNKYYRIRYVIPDCLSKMLQFELAYFSLTVAPEPPNITNLTTFGDDLSDVW